MPLSDPLTALTARAGACPCGSGAGVAQCCGPYLEGTALPAKAEALMRSRYSAYVLKQGHYLRASWHPSSCPPRRDLGDDATRWQRLEILATQGGGPEEEEGVVEFVAWYQGGALHERSRFVRHAGRWCYLDGELLAPPGGAVPGRNAPCPCGSGNKFKRCCGR